MRHADLSGILAALPPGDAAVVRRGAATIVGTMPSEVVVASGAAAFSALRRIEASGGFWIGFASFDLGRSVERVTATIVDDLSLPDLVFARYDDHLELVPGAAPLVIGTGAGARALERAVAHPVEAGAPTLLSPMRSSLDRDEFEDRVRTVLGLLEAGECYQVNLTRRLRSPALAEPRRLFADLAVGNPAPHAALVDVRDTAGVAVVSASPERYLARRGPLVETRPIKGTAADRAGLVASAKDRAENVMIVDLARNDLGRVCEFGSVEVSGLCEVEQHPGLHHLVSTVRGRLRLGAGLTELVAATFPPASVTGAPKPRVLQAIEDLEPVRRGAYCGAVGWIDAAREQCDLAVAIRTFTITEAGTDLGVGSGIVADSVPRLEWDETCLKARRLLAVANGGLLSRTTEMAGATA